MLLFALLQAVDVWSFGIVLYELWALREPYDGLNYHALLHMMSSSKEAVRPALPGRFVCIFVIYCAGLSLRRLSCSTAAMLHRMSSSKEAVRPALPGELWGCRDG
jgi:hypothetical protein